MSQRSSTTWRSRSRLIPLGGIVEQVGEDGRRSRHDGGASKGECLALSTPFKTTTLFRSRQTAKL